MEATRLSDKADTTAAVADGPPAPMLAENEVEFLSAADLAQLRMGSSTTATTLKNDLNSNGQKGRKKIGKSSIKNIFPVVSSTLVDKEEDTVPAPKSKENIAALREIALDHQYNENNDTKWANIPDDEILPIDRAAPCLFHLLQ